MLNLENIILEVLNKNKWHDFIDERCFDKVASEIANQINSESEIIITGEVWSPEI